MIRLSRFGICSDTDDRKDEYYDSSSVSKVSGIELDHALWEIVWEELFIPLPGWSQRSSG